MTQNKPFRLTKKGLFYVQKRGELKKGGENC
jgi:hypothetical protein